VAIAQPTSHHPPLECERLLGIAACGCCGCAWRSYPFALLDDCASNS